MSQSVYDSAALLTRYEKLVGHLHSQGVGTSDTAVLVGPDGQRVSEKEAANSLRALGSSRAWRESARQLRLVESWIASFEKRAGLASFSTSPELSNLLNNSTAFRALDCRHREAFVELANSLPNRKEVKGWIKLLERSDHVLTSRDRYGESLLVRLQQIATQPMLAERAIRRNELLRALRQDLTTPETAIRQEYFRRCAQGAMQYMMVRECPADYVRLFKEWFATGTAVLADGGSCPLEVDALRHRKWSDGRSITSRVFQSSLIEYCNGSEWNYSYAKDTSMCGKEKVNGTEFNWSKKGLDALIYRGRRYAMASATVEVDPHTDRQHTASPLPSEALVFRSRSSTGPIPSTPACQELLARADRGQLTHVWMNWERRGPDSLHSVVLLGRSRENGKSYVHIYNPWGISRSNDLKDPPRTVCSFNGRPTERMSEEVFRARLRGFTRPPA